MKKGLCIIPARGGSKRIPRKNIEDFLGKPIIAYPVQAALESQLFEEVIVSTDDEGIAEIAIKYGAKVPFMRSVENSSDFATTVDVLVEVINQFKKNSPIRVWGDCRYGACIYPTAPFVTAKTLQNAYNQLIEGDFDSIYPVQKFGFPIQRAVVFNDKKVTWMNPENAMVRSQDLVPTYHDAGQFYFFKTEILLEKRTILTENSSAIVISEMDAQDIDNEDDWRMAELKYQLRNENL